MPNIITILCETPDEILNAGAYGAGAVVRVQTSATETGIFADISGTGSTPTVAIVAATRSYSAFDPSGLTTSWYRTRYENVGATRVSDWTDVFQVGGESANFICSVYDVEQALGEALSPNDRETVIDHIKAVTVAIEGFTGRWFIPRPLSGTTTYRTHTRAGYTLHIPKGIRSVTTLSLASSSQPATGGSYTAQTATSYYLDPPEMERDAGWPPTRICFISPGRFYGASYGAEIVGAFGWSAVPDDIQGIGVRAVMRRYIGKSGAGAAVAVGPEGTPFILPDMSGADRRLLEWYRDDSGSVR